MQTFLLGVDTALLAQRVVIRRFRENDGKAVWDLLENNVSRLSDYHKEHIRMITDPELAEIYVRKKLANWILQQEYCFGVWEKQDAQLVGLINIFDVKWGFPQGHLEFLLDHEFTRKGIMTEALAGVLNFSFQQLKLEKIYFTTLMDDYASQRLVRKCGFRREGDLRHAYKLQSGDVIDLMLLALTRAELEKV